MLYLLAYIAGVLTTLSPCVLPMLPVIIGGSLTEKSKIRPLIITASLGLSIVVFTLLLKAGTLLIDIPDQVWKVFSASLIFIVGISMLFPAFWTRLTFIIFKGKVSNASHSFLHKHEGKSSKWSAIMLGVSLGPVFTSCSPIYFIILGSILPQSFINAVVLLSIYALGISVSMLVVSLAGQKLFGRLKALSNPNGLFKKIMGIILIVVAIAIATGLEKSLETFLIQNGYAGVVDIETWLFERFEN